MTDRKDTLAYQLAQAKRGMEKASERQLEDA